MRDKLILYGFMIGILLTVTVQPIGAESASGGSKEFTLVTAMVAEGANIWLPSMIILKNGEEVKLKLRNVAKAEHGFAIDELGIKEVIPVGETKEITIKPGSKGVLRYYCHLHPGHINGQLLVQE